MERYMADSTDKSSSSGNPNKKRVRGPTMMTQIDKRCCILKDEWKDIDNGIKEAIWVDVQEKSRKGRENVAKNVYPHVLSRGGYRMLEETIKNERISSRDDSTLDDNGSPSPPSRHELWKRARQKKGGEYTSKSTQAVAEKIDSLVEEAEKCVFVPHGRNDILTAALGTSEHGGRVCGVGKHHKQST
ncbi:uncharacterized protein LOC131659730 [Vicia villosa]|uniref:uncharacterized protein LOC131659730 n=1 Tax=Vicia villosa TaxID=3911 RepID=UPI00273B6051|nr:uncharacterized protein LOC131659730 [Vicia villosa]